MSAIAIRVENLSKLYRIGERSGGMYRYKALSDGSVGSGEVHRHAGCRGGTPCQPYFSGMYVRLAFAIAAHLEPEILLVDESLP
jgi:hypothetical protein